MFKVMTFVGIALCAFMLATTVHAAVFPANAPVTVTRAAHAAGTTAAANLTAPRFGLGVDTNLLHPARIADFDGMSASSSAVQRIILDSPDNRENRSDREPHHRERHHSRRWNRRHDKLTGGSSTDPSPTPEPSSVLLFAIGMSALILLEHFRPASKAKQSEATRNNSNS